MCISCTISHHWWPELIKIREQFMYQHTWSEELKAEKMEELAAKGYNAEEEIWVLEQQCFDRGELEGYWDSMIKGLLFTNREETP